MFAVLMSRLKIQITKKKTKFDSIYVTCFCRISIANASRGTSSWPLSIPMLPSRVRDAHCIYLCRATYSYYSCLIAYQKDRCITMPGHFNPPSSREPQPKEGRESYTERVRARAYPGFFARIPRYGDIKFRSRIANGGGIERERETIRSRSD